MKIAIRVLGAALLLTVPAVGRAQTVPDLGSATLEDLLNVRITTATRSAEGVAEAPARVQVVTSAQIQRRGYMSLADVLKDLSDFKVDFGGDPNYPTELTVDGTRGASEVVLLLDGIRISSPTNEPLAILANYPVHNARQIEIVYGPASALYGADAFSAVINIITRDVGEGPALALSTSAGQSGRYNESGSYGVRLGSRATLMVAGQAYSDRQPDLSRYYPSDFNGLTAQRTGTFQSIFGPMTPVGPVSPAFAAPQSARSLHAAFRAGPLQAMVFRNDSRVSTTSPKTPDNGLYNADAFYANALTVTAASYTARVGRATSVSTVMFSRHELDPESGYRNVNTRMERNYKYAYGSMAKGEEQVSWTLTPSVTMTTGATFERFYSVPQTAGLNEPLRSVHAPGAILGTTITDDIVTLRYANSGAFGQAQYTVTPNIAFTLGARADYNTRYGGTFNPRVGLVGRPRRGTTLKVLYGTAFLAPSPYQAYHHYGSFYSTDGGRTYASRFWHVPNPDLEPERKKTLEVNLLQSLGGRVHLSANAFYSRFADLIEEQDRDPGDMGFYRGWPVADIDAPANEGLSTNYGGTLALDFLQAFDGGRRVEARAAITLADGRERDQPSDVGAPIGAMVPVQVRFRTDIDWHRWSLAPRLSIVGRQRLLATMPASPDRRTLDGYATVDANLRRRDVFRNLDLFVTVENALDRRYRAINAGAYLNADEMIGVPQNPRRLAIGVDLHVR
jgi:outer membrane cobalamin receptor